MPLRIPNPTTPLHLYRHLLRESTYLPALCRSWITSHIQQRFRDCGHGRHPPQYYVKHGHSSLQYLRSVNAGHIRRLERLCFMATGRIGKRRRILATSQLSSRPEDTAELERSRLETPPGSCSTRRAPTATDATIPTLHKHDWLENWSLDMITALANSQVAQQAKDWPQSMRRQLDTKYITEGRNSFGQLYNPKLLRNKLKKHWASVLHQLMPPLPQGEWDRLASLVRGEADVDALKIPRRRPVASSAQDSSLVSASNEQWDWSQHALKPARVIERGSSRQRKTLTGREDQDPRGPGRPIGIRVITPRKLQRLYSRVWTMSPTMKKNPKNEKWFVSWGGQERTLSNPSAYDLMFFQGVTKDGRIVSKANPSSKR